MRKLLFFTRSVFLLIATAFTTISDQMDDLYHLDSSSLESSRESNIIEISSQDGVIQSTGIGSDLFDDPVNKFIGYLDEEDGVFINPRNDENSLLLSSIENYHLDPSIMSNSTDQQSSVSEKQPASTQKPNPLIFSDIFMVNPVYPSIIYLNKDMVRLLDKEIVDVLDNISNIPDRTDDTVINQNELAIMCNLLLKNIIKKSKQNGLPYLIGLTEHNGSISIPKMIIEILFHCVEHLSDLKSCAKLWVTIKKGLMNTKSLLKIQNGELNEMALFNMFIFALSPRINSTFIKKYIHSKYFENPFEDHNTTLLDFCFLEEYLYFKNNYPRDNFTSDRFFKAYLYIIRLISNPIMKRLILGNINVSRKNGKINEMTALHFMSSYHLHCIKDYYNIILGNCANLNSYSEHELLKNTTFPYTVRSMMIEIEQDIHNIFQRLINPFIEYVYTNGRKSQSMNHSVIRNGFETIAGIVKGSIAIINCIEIPEMMKFQIRRDITSLGCTYLSLRKIALLSVINDNLRIPQTSDQMLNEGMIGSILSMFDYQRSMTMCRMLIQVFKPNQSDLRKFK